VAQEIAGNKNRLVQLPVIVLFAVAVLVVALFGFYVFGGQVGSAAPDYSKNISTFDVSDQTVNGSVRVRSYAPVLADDLDWKAMSEDEREGTVRYAVQEARNMAEADGALNFNVVGIGGENRQSLFFYSGGEFATIYLDGTNAGEVNVS
jgi:hypothetical protein